jgi:DNA-binding NarL/FixJ family response regulator
MSISIVIVDDHPVICHGLNRILDKQESFTIAGEASDAKSALELIAKKQPTVVILDITLQGIDGVSMISRIGEVSPRSKIIMYTMHNSRDYITRSFQAGALGYVLKSDKTEELVTATNSVMANKLYLSAGVPDSILGELSSSRTTQKNNGTATLTRREYEVASLVAQGRNPDQIAETLFISPKTVRVHRTKIMHKLSCSSVHELLLKLPHYFPRL